MQWLGELWRKYHQVFVLLDDKRLRGRRARLRQRLQPVRGPPAGVVGLESLIAERAADRAGGRGRHRPADRRRGAPPAAAAGSSRATPPTGRSRRSPSCGRHVLLLTATPLEDDAHGFFRLLQLLRPEEFPDGRAVRGAAARPPSRCRPAPARRGGSTSAACRRGVGCPVELDAEGWEPLAASRGAREVPRRCRPRRTARRRLIERALASSAALDPPAARRATAGPDDARRRRRRPPPSSSPRLATPTRGSRWLAAQAPRWRLAREKTLVFVAHRETLDVL